jgi:hypothetical protein
MRHQIDWAALGRLHAIKQPRMPKQPKAPPEPEDWSRLKDALLRQADRLMGPPFTVEEVVSILQYWEADAVRGTRRKTLVAEILKLFAETPRLVGEKHDLLASVDADGRWSLAAIAGPDWLS